jgi:hypothetical protein
VITGYDVQMYRNIAQIADNTEGIVTRLKSLERTILIAGLLPTVLPMDIGLHTRLTQAAKAVDAFLEVDEGR